MILRRPHWPHSLLFTACALLTRAPATVAAEDNAFDCTVTTSRFKFDLTSLGGEHTVTRTRETPPTTVLDSVRFDLCGDLPKQSGVNERDQCPDSTRVCLTMTNKKDKENDRVVNVIPIASSSTLDPSYTVSTTSTNDVPDGLSLILHGPKYTDDYPQSLNMSLLCASDASDPTFVSYDGSVLELEWKTPAACGKRESSDDSGGGNEEKDGSNKPSEEPTGSGIGWFFLVLFLAFLAYFGIGAYYNYSTYGATGRDLIPHRDFWQEVPYMLNDVVSHLCSSVRPRRTASRGGYISV